MKILIVCQYFHPEPFKITDISMDLADRNNQVTILTGIPNYPNGSYYKNYGLFNNRRSNLGEIEIKRIPIVPRGKGSIISLILNYLSFMVIGSIFALFEYRSNYDVVLVYQLSPVTMALPGMIVSKLSKAPLVTYVADLWPDSLTAATGIANPVIIGLLNKFVSCMYSQSHKILVTSRGFIEKICERHIDKEKIIYLPQYPEDIYTPIVPMDEEAARQEIPPGFTLVFAGNLGVAQGLDVVLDAALILKENNDINWVLIGDGRARENLERRVLSLGLKDRVRFIGRKPSEKIPIYLALASAAILCLKPEPLFAITLPAKIQSYLACGIPIIGSVDGDAAQVIRESGAGFCAPSGDAREFAAQVLKMRALTIEERKCFSDNAIKYYKENFDKRMLMDKLEKVLFGAISSNLSRQKS